jgi:protein involved in polysaccharide export with SLBB domain
VDQIGGRRVRVVSACGCRIRSAIPRLPEENVMWKVLASRVAILPLLLLLASPLAVAQAAGPGRSSSYRLGVGDQIRLKVYEWRRATGDVYGWNALNADFRVGPDGAVSLPMLGMVPASGVSIDQLAEQISTRLQKAVGLATPPQASVEIVQFRPFYILGSVHHPGEYSYRPGMTVLQALSLAGGTFRIDDPGLLLVRRNLLSASGDLRVLVLEYEGLLARRARLQAELDGSPQIGFPRELLERRDQSEAAQAMAQEQAMFAARRDALHSETTSLNQLKDLLNGEVTSLQSKTKDVDQELALLKQELAQTAAMVQKGLAAAPREFTLRQTELQTEGRRLDLDTAILRAREDIGKAEQSILKLHDKRRGEIMAESAEVERKLVDHAARIKTGKAIEEQEGNASPDLASILDSGSGPLTYSIIRPAGDAGGPQKLAATEASDVEPGDTIEVRRASEAQQSHAASADVADLVGSSIEPSPPAPPKPPARAAPTVHSQPRPMHSDRKQISR